MAAEFRAAADEYLGARLSLAPDAPAAESAARYSSLWPELKELGWFELLVPEAHGGMGLEPPVVAEMFKAVGRHLAPGPLWGSMFVAPWLASRAGNGDAELLLEALGENRTFSWLDPDNGATLSADRVTLIDGALAGVVRVVPSAADADFLVTVAEDGEGASLVLVPAPAPGVSIERHRAIDPSVGFGTVTFDGCRIDSDQLLLQGEGAVLAIVEMRSWLRTLAACEMCGLVDHVLWLTLGYVKDRRQFGRPIGSFQAVKHLLAEIFCAARSLEYSAAMSLADGTPGERELEAVALKAYASRVGVRACEDALQAHGGIGFTDEYELHCYLKRSLTLASQLGDASTLERLLGTAVLGSAGVSAPTSGSGL